MQTKRQVASGAGVRRPRSGRWALDRSRRAERCRVRLPSDPSRKPHETATSLRWLNRQAPMLASARRRFSRERPMSDAFVRRACAVTRTASSARGRSQCRGRCGRSAPQPAARPRRDRRLIPHGCTPSFDGRDIAGRSDEFVTRSADVPDPGSRGAPAWLPAAQQGARHNRRGSGLASVPEGAPRRKVDGGVKALQAATRGTKAHAFTGSSRMNGAHAVGLLARDPPRRNPVEWMPAAPNSPRGRADSEASEEDLEDGQFHAADEHRR